MNKQFEKNQCAVIYNLQLFVYNFLILRYYQLK